jgi:hypothetical protein
MKTNVLGWMAALGFALAVGASPVQALESMSGTYAGKMSCKGYEGTAPTKGKQDITIDVIQEKGIALRVSAGTQLGNEVLAVLAQDAAKTDKGKIGGVDCDLNLATLTGIAIQGDVTVKAGGGKASIKGTLLRLNDAGTVIDVCSYSVKRTSTTAPDFEICPET